MLTVFFAATTPERDALVASGTLDPARHGLPAVEAGGLSPIALVTLDAAVTGADAGAVVNDVLHEPLANLDDGEQLLFRVRPELTAALANGADLERAATLWAATDEMTADRFTRADCMRLLTGLAGLATQAAADGRALYTWLCV